MDPFSVTVGSLALIQASKVLVNFVKKISNAVVDANHELNTLIAELDSLDGVTKSVDDVYQQEMARATTVTLSKPESLPLADQWKFCRRTLSACQQKAAELTQLFEHIYGNDTHEIKGKINALRKSHRRHDKEGKLQQLRTGLDSDRNILSFLLLTITVWVLFPAALGASAC